MSRGVGDPVVWRRVPVIVHNKGFNNLAGDDVPELAGSCGTRQAGGILASFRHHLDPNAAVTYECTSRVHFTSWERRIHPLPAVVY